MELYNTFLRRLAASFVDGMILAAVAYIPNLIGIGTGSIAAIVADFIIFIATVGYVVYLTYRHGATVGKLVAGIRVTSVAMEPISLQQSFVRESPIIFFNGIWLLLMLRYSESDPVAYVVMGLAFVWWSADALCLLMNEKGRALHDFMASTVVIRSIKLPTP